MNYYINYINNTGKFDITFIGLAYEEERRYVDLEERGIKSDIYYRDHSGADYVIRRIVSGFTLLNPWSRYYGQLLLYEHLQLRDRVKKYKAAGENPDIVILHWTSMGLLLPEMKRYFPEAKFILIEEDVTYLGYQRKYEANPTGRRKYLFENLKKDELRTIRNCDLTVTLNEKDRKLLLSDGISADKVFTCALYIDNYKDVIRKPESGKLLFYGAMDRMENYDSVIWFIDNVLRPIYEDKEKYGSITYTLDVVGSKPHPKLIEAAERFNHDFATTKQPDIGQLGDSDHIVTVTGFVEDIRPYLSKAMCMVSPLLLGAGIKAKVLEAMSAGVPVITNSIGIEGIYAEKGKEYIHCETPEEYIEAIQALSDTPKSVDDIGSAGKKFMEDTFNIDKKCGELADRLISL